MASKEFPSLAAKSSQAWHKTGTSTSSDTSALGNGIGNPNSQDDWLHLVDK